MENEEDTDQLRDELKASRHFLTDTEMKNGHAKVLNFHFSELNPYLFDEKLDQVF